MVEMNQALLQPLALGPEFALSTEQECIEHVGAHAHHGPFAGGGVSDHQLQRDGFPGQTVANLLSLPPSNGARYMAHRPAAHDSQYQAGSGISDSGSGSISTSPSSSASSLAYSAFPVPNAYSQQPALSIANSISPYPTATQVFSHPFTFQQPFGGMSDTRSRISSISNHSYSGMLPPTRSSGIGNPVSPSLGTVARDNYTTATPHLSRHTLSPRTQAESLSRVTYNSIPDTPRSVLSVATMSLSPTSAAPYGSTGSTLGHAYNNDTRQQETPPFGPQDTFHQLSCDGQSVTPHIEAKIEKGFFYSQDRCWTCYRRNYFSVQCSYTLTPHIPNARLYITRASKGVPEQIQAMAVSISAVVDGAAGKAIELVQHTPKRDKGPQLQIKKEKLSPTPPGKPHHAIGHEAHGYTLGIGGFHHPGAAAPAVVASPYLPLQSEPADQHQGLLGSPGGHDSQHSNPTAHQHTFERIQFKSATANNGKRRAQQQYYHLIVELYADVRGPREAQPNWIKVAQRVSAAVVVRGRSPSHYQNEGPHSASNSRGGSHGGSGGPAGGVGPSGYGGVGSAASGSARGLSTLTGAGGLGSSLYRGSQYSLEPSPAGSHSVSSASSLSGGPADGLLGDPQPSSSSEDEECKAIGNFDGYQYYPSPLYDAVRASDAAGLDDRRVKHELGDNSQASLANGWHLRGCGRLQGTESSRGYYPDLSAGYSY